MSTVQYSIKYQIVSNFFSSREIRLLRLTVHQQLSIWKCFIKWNRKELLAEIRWLKAEGVKTVTQQHNIPMHSPMLYELRHTKRYVRYSSAYHEITLLWYCCTHVHSHSIRRGNHNYTKLSNVDYTVTKRFQRLKHCRSSEACVSFILSFYLSYFQD